MEWDRQRPQIDDENHEIAYQLTDKNEGTKSRRQHEDYITNENERLKKG